MRRCLALILFVLLAHQAWPDQLSDSYLARPVQATSVLASESPSRPRDRKNGPVHGPEKRRQSTTLSNRHRPPDIKPGDLFKLESSVKAAATDDHHQAKRATNKLILLTDGHEIKLLPLDPDELAPSGGHYVIKTGDFDLGDPQVVHSLKSNPRHLEWLRHKQRVARELSSGSPTLNGHHLRRPSILPHESALDGLLAEQLLYPPGRDAWRKPFISNVGHLLDERFCDRSKSSGQQEQLSSAFVDCLVIYWLDRNNNAIHFGALELSSSVRFELLRANFESPASLRAAASPGGRPNGLVLKQFAPLDACLEAGLASSGDKCSPVGLQVDLETARLHVALATSRGNSSQADVASGRILSGRLEPSAPAGVVKLLYKSQVQSEDFFKSAAKTAAGSSMRNLVATRLTDGRPALLFLNSKFSSKISTIDLEPGATSAQHALNSAAAAATATTTLIDVHWEGIKSKIQRQAGGGADRNGSLSLVAMTLGPTCNLLWLTSNNELYSTNLHDQNLDTTFLVKLIAARPLIRWPVVGMQLMRDSLFFMDSTRRSLMVYKLPSSKKQASALNGAQTIPAAPRTGRIGAHILGDEPAPKLASTHRVLLVEMAPIQDFVPLELPRGRRSGRRANWCSAWRSNSLRQSSRDAHPVGSQTNQTARVAGYLFAPEAVELARQATVDDAAKDQINGPYQLKDDDHDHAEDATTDEIPPFVHSAQHELASIFVGVLVLTALACFKCALWLQKNKLLAPLLEPDSQQRPETPGGHREATSGKPLKDIQSIRFA